MRQDSPTTKESSRLRLALFSGTVTLLVGLLVLRLAQMQILDRERYDSAAQQNSIETKIVLPARGYIFDRHGSLLVDNQTTYNLTLTPRSFDPADIPLIAQLLGVEERDVRRRYENIRQYSTYRTSLFYKDLRFDQFMRIRENLFRLRGINFEEGQQRRYRSSPRLAHALGYIREVSEAQLRNLGPQGYRQGDKVGQAGIEAEYEPILRGRPGRRLVLVNVHGMEVQPYEEGQQDVDAQAGYALYLTIDAKVQALAESLFVGKRGGAVAIDTQTGGIVAMVSSPDYDPQGFTGRMSQNFVDFVWRNPEKPLFNRATQSMQPPGSTWKPFMAAVALQEGIITPESRIVCRGGVSVGRFFKCMGVHGSIDVRTAVEKSCNSFFYQLMLKMELNTWANYARAFGFGGLAPIDFPDQSPGLIPDSTYFNRTFGEGVWGAGYTINLGIGQGNLGVTPLQMARMVSTIANGGTLYAPHFIRYQVNPADGVRHEPSRARPRTVPVSPENLAVIREGMTFGFERSGTSRAFRVPMYQQAGKTGTVQNPGGKDHSMFVGFAPADNPRIAVAVFVENAGFGSTAAAPTGSLMMEQFLTGQISRPQIVARVRTVRSQGLRVGG